MEKLLDLLINFIKRYQKINYDNQEIIRYGLELFIIKISFTTVILIVAAILHSFFECLLFTLIFSIIRTSAGGYHASTRIECFIESVTTFVSVIFILKVVEEYHFIIIIIMFLAVISSIIIWLISPIDTKNKPLNNDEKYILKKRTRIIVVSETILAFFTLLIGFYKISCSVMLAFIITAILLIVESLNKKSKDCHVT